MKSVQRSRQYLQLRHAFIKRGLLARDEARAIEQYVSTDEMLPRLDAALGQARSLLLARRV